MRLNQLFVLVERLRKEAIGEPIWIAEKKVYEYQEQSARVVAILKITRAAHGLTALKLLCGSGLFIDFGAIMRCVNDCAEEVYFLMEDLNNPSAHVAHFVKAFFESTIDDHLSKKTPSVQRDKIRSAVVRVLKDAQDEKTRALMDNIYKTFNGYVHANYAHIMEVYNGHTLDFNLGGVPSIRQRQMRMEQVEVAADAVLHAAAFAAHRFSLNDLLHDIVQSWQQP